jgi:hypothetical protein
MMGQVLEPSLMEFRNFNMCPHCESNGEDAFLCRLSEGIPMISRSDGKTFHLLLADRPLPYPMENGEERTRSSSVCFWYAYGAGKSETKTTVVVFESLAGAKEKVFRQIEFIADVLADELLQRRELAVFYNLMGNSILKLSY